MRILYLHQYFSTPESPWITRSYEFARRLIANGHEVRMITSSAMLPPRYQGYARTTTVEIDTIPTTIIPVAYANEMSFGRRIQSFFRFALLASREAMRYKADVIFATSTPLTIAIPGIWARIWQRKPMVFEVRDLWPEMPIAVGALKNPVARALARSLEWIAYHSARHLVALSPGMAEGMMARGIPADRITIIPNSCDVDLFDVPPDAGDEVRARLGLSPDQPLVIYTGTFGLLNGVEYLVDIAAITQQSAPEIVYLLIGDGAKRSEVADRARQTGVLDRNLWLWDPIPKTEVVKVFATATAATSLFIPLKPMWKNSANKFFDALAAGRPIVINYGGWQADILNETGAGLPIDPYDRDKAAAQFVDFLRDPARLAAAREAARDLALTRFNRDRMAEKLEQVLIQAARKT